MISLCYIHLYLTIISLGLLFSHFESYFEVWYHDLIVILKAFALFFYFKTPTSVTSIFMPL